MPLLELFGAFVQNRENMSSLLCKVPARRSTAVPLCFLVQTPIFQPAKFNQWPILQRTKFNQWPILQRFDVNRPLYSDGLPLTKELFVEPSNSCLLSLGSRQLQ